MWLFGGLITGSVSGFLLLEISTSFSQGLPDARQRIVVWALTAFASVTGFLVGGTVVTRATRSRERLILFSGLTAGIGGGAIGAGLALSVLAMYLYTYAAWPTQLTDQILLVLAYPAFGAVGFFAGAAGWALFGLLAGALLSRAAPRLH